MKVTNDSMLRALASRKTEVRPGVTFEARVKWPFAWVGNLMLAGLVAVGLVALIRLVMG